jgi:general secretion pathway protein J
MRPCRTDRGFTLVELMVALFAMALLAIMSWRGLDGMTRVRAQTEAYAREVLTLQVGLAQWTADLDSLIQLPRTAALDWNGRVLRMTRRGAASGTDGVLVVAWTWRVVNGNGTWLRWQSRQLVTRGDLDAAWQEADTWSQNAGADQRKYEVAILPLEAWQIFYFRNDAWTNPQSSAAAIGGTGEAIPPLPDGVRLVLTLASGQAVSGQLTRDWVRPTLGGNKS